jgi:hypothetical protein
MRPRPVDPVQMMNAIVRAPALPVVAAGNGPSG